MHCVACPVALRTCTRLHTLYSDTKRTIWRIETEDVPSPIRGVSGTPAQPAGVCGTPRKPRAGVCGTPRKPRAVVSGTTAKPRNWSLCCAVTSLLLERYPGGQKSSNSTGQSLGRPTSEPAILLRKQASLHRLGTSRAAARTSSHGICTRRPDLWQLTKDPR